MASLTPFSGALGERKASHLLRRATFGPTVSDIQQFAGYSISEAMNVLFQEPEVPDPPLDVKTGNTWLNPKSITGTNSEQEVLIDYLEAWWLHQMFSGGTNIRERIVWFLHSHIPVNRDVVPLSEAIYYQNKLYRYYAYGSFKDLFHKVCIDNAMLKYIDGTLNEKGSPNENFAREMFELYSIGKGPQIADGDYTNYTEQDIKAAAKVLTGYKMDETYTNLDADSSIPIGKLVVQSDKAIYHDVSDKTFSAAFSEKTITTSALNGGYATEAAATQELQEMLDMIFDKDETARALCRKLYRFFIYYEISAEVESDIIIPLAVIFKQSGYNLKTVVSKLLSSQHFFDTDTVATSDDSIGALIKSPLEIISHSLRFFGIKLPLASDLSGFYTNFYGQGISLFIREQGLDFLRPFDVAGFDPYFQAPGFNRLWITPTHLAYRYRFSEYMMTGVGSDGEALPFKMDIVSFVKDSTNISDPSDAETIVRTLTDSLFPFQINDTRFGYFLNTVFLDTLATSYWTTEWNNYLDGGDDTIVRSKLELLVNALMQSPEYQLF